MYYLIVWDRELVTLGQDACLRKLSIPLDLANNFFQLHPKKYELLSSLSFDDYDLFSANEIEQLIYELKDISTNNESWLESISSMIELLYEAFSSRKSVLFDPFRRE